MKIIICNHKGTDIDCISEEQKTILINGIRLPLMPTDISAFSGNAILSEVYIRAPGALLLDPKHSSSVIHLLNLPILLPQVRYCT